ncbi:hypothetical protein BGX34_003784 [Mortierella sp. NVP85]|nr:hypothetical protein BGX34_003784 [Mortierella sp. NVP85]
MDPPPTPPRREFLKPQGPVRPRGTAAGAAYSDSTTTSTSATPTSSAPHSPVPQPIDDTPELPQDTAAQHSGIVYYKKPAVLPSQMDPSQPTQLLPDIDGLELNEAFAPFACLQGHSATMSHDLTREKSSYIAGTSEDCDIIINHGFWEGLGLNPKVLNEPWFVLELEPSKSVQGEMKVYIKDVSTTGVYIGGKILSDRYLLKYGDNIKGAPDGSKSDLFHYSFKKYAPDTDTIQGDLSTYHILSCKPFARGTYAEVFKATDEKDQALYACKVFNRQSHGWTDQELTGVEFEISLLREMQHDNIVKFQDTCQSNNKTYLILEYLDGDTLYAYYHSKNSYFAEYEAREIFRQACDGVYYLHSQGIVHRDIKCDNIMVLETTEGIKVKLIDFGKALTTILMSVVHIDPYIAPETKVGDESNGYGKAVDVWSLGIVLFRMLTGEYPFRPKRYDQLNAANFAKTDAESTEVEQMSVELEGEKQDPKITYSVGYRKFYKEDWRPRLNRQAARSSEGTCNSLDERHLGKKCFSMEADFSQQSKSF